MNKYADEKRWEAVAGASDARQKGKTDPFGGFAPGRKGKASDNSFNY